MLKNIKKLLFKINKYLLSKINHNFYYLWKIFGQNKKNKSFVIFKNNINKNLKNMIIIQDNMLIYLKIVKNK
jgi:hypothetical protein